LSALENENIICISSVDWDPIWTRKQQVMSRLPKSNKILYIEPPVTLLSPLKDPKSIIKWFTFLKGFRPWSKNIFLFSPPVTLPFGNKYRVINRLNQWWVSLFLKAVMAHLEIKNPIVWTYLPNSVDLVDKLGQKKLLVYDCVDEHSEYSGFIDKNTMLDMERQLIDNCDVVFVTAKGLYDSKREYARKIYFLPNAADVEHFMKAQRPDTPVPQEIASIPRPVVGFVGVIQDWIDLDLIRETALSHPEWSFVMVGPVAAGIDISGLQDLPNVYFLGRKDVSVLPSYMKAFDVCINPFKLNELTDKVSPLKFYEYLASGKPIVSVNMPGVSAFSDIVEIADNKEEFIQGIERALNEDDQEKLNRRLERASENSWESRVDFMMSRIIEIMNTPGHKHKGGKHVVN